MNVFTPYIEPLLTAKALDPRRLNKQIIECKQIIKAIQGQSMAWRNHPAVLQYRNHLFWLTMYTKCMDCFRQGNQLQAGLYDSLANDFTPPFLDEAWCQQMRRRLFTKDSNYYSQWKDLGTSDINWYFVDNQLVKYFAGKRIE